MRSAQRDKDLHAYVDAYLAERDAMVELLVTAAEALELVDEHEKAEDYRQKAMGLDPLKYNELIGAKCTKKIQK